MTPQYLRKYLRLSVKNTHKIMNTQYHTHTHKITYTHIQYHIYPHADHTQYLSCPHTRSHTQYNIYTHTISLVHTRDHINTHNITRDLTHTISHTHTQLSLSLFLFLTSILQFCHLPSAKPSVLCFQARFHSLKGPGSIHPTQ